MAKKTMSALDFKKHGVGGVIWGNIRERKQDRRARAKELYAVVFFPKIHGIGKAAIGYLELSETLAQSPDAARVKFMDKMAPGQSWQSYHDAGHRIRRIKVVDLGDAH